MRMDLPGAVVVPILPTKLFRPLAGPEVVARDRLHDLLSDGVSVQLILVSAAAGSGKTTMVADWAGRWDGPTAWLSLDPSDDDPVSFLRYLVEAIRGMDPAAAGRALALLELTPPPPVLAVAGTLVAELAGQATRGVLILDDYHVITRREIHEAVTLLAERAPPGVTLLLISRSDPPLPLARMRARGQLREIRDSDLRFRPDEAGSLLSRISGSAPGDDALRTLMVRTEGWAVGLQLAALALRQAPDPDVFVADFRGTHAFVADYLADEVLARIPEDLQAFLVRSSLLTRMTGPLCDAALGREGSQEVLAALSRANLFLVPLDGERRWYRYHHLFGDLLRRRLPGGAVPPPGGSAGTLDSGAVGILERAASWCELHGQVDDAIEYCIRAGDPHRAADLVARHGVVTLSRGEAAEVLRWLDRLPVERVRSSPDHGVLGAWASLLLEDPVSMEAHAAAAEEAWKGGNRPFPHVEDVEFHVAFTRAEARALLAGRPELALPELEEIRQQIPERSAALRTAAGIILGERLALTGRYRDALAAHEVAERMAREGQMELLRVTSATGIAESLLAQGRVREVIVLVDEVTASHTGGGVIGSRLGNLAAVKALAALELDEGVLVSEAVSRAWGGLGGSPDPDDGWRMAGRLGRDLHPAMHSTGRGVLHTHLAQFGTWLRTGEVDVARRRIERIREVAPDLAPVVQVLVEWVEVRYREARGDVKGLARWAPADPGPTESALWNDLGHLTRARAALASRDPATASSFLDPLVEGLRERDAGLLLAPALLLQAEAVAERSRRQEARSLVSEALEITAGEGRLGPWLDARPAVLSLLEETVGDAAASTLALNHATRILARRAEVDAPASMDGAGHPASALSDRELSVLRLMAAGRTNREIASALFLAEGTIKKHTHNLFGKMGVRNRTEAVAEARRSGLLGE